MMHPASGTRVLLEHNGRLLAYQRDNDPAIPHPGKWDFFGGGVEPGEALLPPAEGLLDCGYRELKEEIGLVSLHLEMLTVVESKITPGKMLGRAFGRLTDRDVSDIRFGTEGQWYKFFYPAEILDIDFVPQLQEYTAELYGLEWMLASNGLANRVEALELAA
jgi:8-oxo-dGTP pyrophosphatase MutT (NUDIX family)